MVKQDYLESPGQAWEDDSFHHDSKIRTFPLHSVILKLCLAHAGLFLLDMSTTSAQAKSSFNKCSPKDSSMS